LGLGAVGRGSAAEQSLGGGGGLAPASSDGRVREKVGERQLEVEKLAVGWLRWRKAGEGTGELHGELGGGNGNGVGGELVCAAGVDGPFIVGQRGGRGLVHAGGVRGGGRQLAVRPLAAGAASRVSARCTASAGRSIGRRGFCVGEWSFASAVSG
jgi:hypothetical protein